MAILERELVSHVRSLISDEYRVYEEVGFYNRCIDMVLLSAATVITVEFKINDWRKALRQIRDHQIVADYSYLCMPKRRVAADLMASLQDNGIGLWLYDNENGTLDEILSPRETPYKWEFYKSSFVKMLAEREAIHE
jgi:hypothetical protein